MERRQARSQRPHPAGCSARHARTCHHARTLSGALAYRRSTAALAAATERRRSAPATRFLGPAASGVTCIFAYPSPAGIAPQAGHRAGRAFFAEAARERGDKPPPAGTALAPSVGSQPATSLVGEMRPAPTDRGRVSIEKGQDVYRHDRAWAGCRNFRRALKDMPACSKRPRRPHNIVIAGLDPAIHAAARLTRRFRPKMILWRGIGTDRRVEPGGHGGATVFTRRSAAQPRAKS